MIHGNRLILGTVLMFAAGLTTAADENAAKKEAAKESPTKLEIKGTFEAGKTAEISLSPKAWTTCITSKAVRHGAIVKRGQPIVWLDTEKLEEQIKTAENALALSTLALKQSELDLQIAQSRQPLDLNVAKKAKATTDESLSYFLTTELPRLKATTKRILDSAKFRLEYAQEEFDQLEKMYKADDLTEETEELILKQARRAIDARKFSLDSVTISTRRKLNHDLPKQQAGLVDAAKSGGLDYHHTRATAPLTLAKKKLEHEKTAQDRKKAAEKLGKLKKDRQLAIIKAPIDGIVYYGRASRGKWSDKTKVDSQLRPGGTVTPKQVFITIVSQQPLMVRVNLEEKNLHRIRPGMAGVATPIGFPGKHLDVNVVRISRIPIAAGVFDCLLRVKPSVRPSAIRPGMTCTVTFPTKSKKSKAKGNK
jgi:HlyD family secretion protein